MKLYRIEYQGKGLWRNLHEGALQDIKDKIGEEHPNPYTDRNYKAYAKMDFNDKQNGRFFFTQKGYNKIYDYIQSLLTIDGIEIIKIELSKNDKRILWIDSKKLQVVINFDATIREYIS